MALITASNADLRGVTAPTKVGRNLALIFHVLLCADGPLAPIEVTERDVSGALSGASVAATMNSLAKSGYLRVVGTRESRRYPGNADGVAPPVYAFASEAVRSHALACYDAWAARPPRREIVKAPLLAPT